MFLIAFIVGFATVCAFLSWMLFKQRRNKIQLGSYVSVLESAQDIGGIGIVVYDDRQNLIYRNRLAAENLCTIHNDNVFDQFTDFVSYIFDYAVEDEWGFASRYGKGDLLDGDPAFSEVVYVGDDRSCLIEINRVEDGKTVVLIRDVSELRKQYENITLLNQTNVELSLAIEAASCGVLMIDPKSDGCPVTFINHAGRKSTALGEDHDLDVLFSPLFSRFVNAQDYELIMATIRAGETLRKQIKFFDGRWFDFRLSPVFDQNKEVDLYVGVLSDITTLKTREEEFFKAQKLDALGQLSAGLAHDFNNILSIIEGYVRMVEMNPDNQEKVAEYAKHIKDASNRGAGITKQMMTFARHKVSQETVTDIKRLFAEQEVLLRPLLDETVDFTMEFGEGELYARCEADNLTQILMNFVINANDAIQNGGYIKVSLRDVEREELPEFVRDRDVDYLLLRVRDDGMGMAPEVCERIFDPFFTTKGQGEGTGLGLSVVYGLVNDMGGYVDVRSEFGVGSEFSVYIPRSDDVVNVKDMPSDKSEAGALSLEGYTALIAEDEPDLRAILSELLVDQGMTVLEAENGTDALVVQDEYEKDIDVLLTDLVMPGMSGVKLAEMVTCLRSEMEVVFMSGYPARGQDAKVELPEGAMFIPKPIDFDALCGRIHDMIHNKDKRLLNSVKSDDVSTGGGYERKSA